MKKGANGGNLTVLTKDQLDRVYEASLSLLMDPGFQTNSKLILNLFEENGAQVNHETGRIRIDREMVEVALKTTPSSFILHGRNDPDMDILLEMGRVYYGMGGTPEPLFWDWDQWRPRQPTKEDMINNTRVGHALPNIDFVQAICMSGDMPTNEIFYHDFESIFRNTTKPTVITILERPFTQNLLEMTSAVSGGEDALREKPSVLGILTPISPLKIDVMNEGIFDAVNAGVPILYAPGPLMGATAPATVAGIVVLTNAEVLFGIVLTQLIKPGAKVVLKPDTDVFDMKTTQVTYSSPEQNLGKIAMVQMAKRYNLPIYGLAGGVECKTPDAEAAAEASMSMLLNGLAGMNMNQSLGTLSWGQYGSPEMVVICDEIVNNIKRVLEGIAFDDDTLSVDVIRKVGPGGDFLSQDHTIRHFRKEFFFPKLFRRQTIDEWINSGSKMIHEVAHERVQQILENSGPVELLPGVDAALEKALEKALKSAQSEPG